MTVPAPNCENSLAWKKRIREMFRTRNMIVDRIPAELKHYLILKKPLSSAEWSKASRKARERGLLHWARCLGAVAAYLKRISVKSNMIENAMQARNAYDLSEAFRRVNTEELGKRDADLFHLYQLRWEGRWETEMELASKLLGKYPHDPQLLVEWGIALTHCGHLDKADDAFKAALEDDWSLSNAHFGRGDICVRKGNIREAIDHLLEAISQDPSYSSAWSNLGVCCFLLGFLEECEMCFKMACSWPDSPADAWSNLGVLLICQGREQEGLPILWMAVVKRPYEKEVWWNLFLTYHYYPYLLTCTLRLPEIPY